MASGLSFGSVLRLANGELHIPPQTSRIVQRAAKARDVSVSDPSTREIEILTVVLDRGEARKSNAGGT
jgi:hypothetical protein